MPAATGSSASGVVEGHELSIEGVDHHGARLLADEHPAEVVPGPVRARAAVDVGVELAAGHRAQVEGKGTQGAVLLPAEPARRVAREPHDGVAHRRTGRGRQRSPVDPGPAAPCGLEASPARLVDHDGRPCPVAVHRAEAGGVPGEPAAGVGAAVHRVEHDHHRAVTAVQPGLLAHHPQASALEHRERRLVGGQVAVVLPGRGAGRAPVGQRVEGRTDGRRRRRGARRAGPRRPSRSTVGSADPRGGRCRRTVAGWATWPPSTSPGSSPT